MNIQWSPEAIERPIATLEKGTEHPAKLNFGDCFAYALAKGRWDPKPNIYSALLLREENVA